MASIVFRILEREGVFLNVSLCFLLFSPVYLLDIYLVIPLSLFLLYREILNLAAPSEQMVILYKVYGLPLHVIFWFNILLIITVNSINVIILGALSFFGGESIIFNEYLRQVLVLNGVLFFAAAFANTVLYFRLRRAANFTVQKMIIVPLFVFSVLIIFTVLFLLFQDPSILAALVFIMILLIWKISVFNKYDRAKKYF